MVGAALHRFRDSACYCGADFEGEGLNLHYSRPWQVAYCIADNKRVKSTHEAFIRWDDINVSPDAARLTRFDLNRYRQLARPAKEVLDEYDQVVYDHSTEVVWMNGLFYDFYIHMTWRRLCGRPYDDSYVIRSLDLKGLTQAKKKGWVPDVSSPEAFLAWQYRATAYREKGLKSRLEVVGPEEGIIHDYTSLHDATSDISLMMKVFWKRLMQVEF